ncbi:universal stress protein [Thalassovita aquimarina]|uniref:Universal stress protein n=1 Tax=Thalassovita aquimarina TaxID=2785917 RepID=A0ABS5HLB2_9RHOB|nr:universal stress protein [Thalassovita aquimarina]
MFSKIMTPVDLAHAGRLQRALDCAADLAGHYGAELVYVGVTAETPGPLGHNPEEYAERLNAFVAEQAKAHGIKASAHAMAAHDPTTDLDDNLFKAIDETGADLVVMQSHIPNFTDYIWPSNGGKLASHAKVSVMVVRG